MEITAILAVSLVLGLSGPQQPPRDGKPAARVEVPDASPEAALQKKIAASPNEVANYLVLARVQEARGAGADAEATLVRARDIAPANKDVLTALAGLFNRRGDFERTIAALEAVAQLSPSDPAGFHLVATYYWEKAQKDKNLTPAQRWTYIFEGISATDKVLALNADHVEALTYKNILLRMRAAMEPDPAQQQQTLAEADALRTRALALNKTRTLVGGPGTVGATVPIPPPLPSGASAMNGAGMAPVRVGGTIRVPAKIRNVPPVYPLEALQAGVSGVVILEAIIGIDGSVANARILKSIPLLDQAAVDAVSQWAFELTLLNGQPVPVIMTVTVNFTLPQN